MGIISLDFLELLPLAHLLYGDPGTVHHRWEDGSWRTIQMLDGVSQGCLLLAIFAALVLDRVLRLLDALLCQQANACLLYGDCGDDGHGSIAHLIGWVDDVTARVPLVDLIFL